MVVVLPAPLAPSRATIFPSGTVKRDAAQYEHDIVVDHLEIGHDSIGAGYSPG